MAETKLLSYHENKSCLLIVGNEEQESKLEKELEETPVLLYNKPMKVAKQAKYLGEEIKSGVSDSIIATIKKRTGNVMIAISEIVSLVNDPRANAIGNISLGLEIWEMAILPYLLNSAGTWAGINKKAMDLLDKIQKKFLQRLLQVKTAPIPLLFWDTGQLLMSNQIMKMKLLLIHHLASLEDSSLAKKIYIQQKIKKYPGLVTETREILKKCDLTLDMMETFSKREWKVHVKEFIATQNTEDLLSMMTPYKKLDVDEFQREECKLKDYMKDLPYSDALIQFRLRGKVLNSVKTHFKSEKKYRDDLWSCEGCSSFLDTSFNILHQCHQYEDLRDNLNLEKNRRCCDILQSSFEEKRRI